MNADELIQIARRSAEGGFSERLREGWYPSAPRDDAGHVQHDRHVITLAASLESTVAACANEMEVLLSERVKLQAEVLVLRAVKAELSDDYAAVKKLANQLAEALAFARSCIRGGEYHGADHEMIVNALVAWTKLDPSSVVDKFFKPDFDVDTIDWPKVMKKASES